MKLPDHQIKLIKRDLTREGIMSRDLLDSLTDHLACMAEERIMQGTDSRIAISQAKTDLLPQGALVVQRALFMETFKQYTHMRKAQFIIGYLSVAIIMIGYTFKIMHWPTANIQLALGSVVFAWLFLPAYWANRFQVDQLQKKRKHIAYYATNALLAMVTASSMLPVFMHWPYKQEFTILSLLIMAFYFMPKIFLNLYRKNLAEARLSV